jgi:hypothetical protein
MRVGKTHDTSKIKTFSVFHWFLLCICLCNEVILVKRFRKKDGNVKESLIKEESKD